MSTYTVVYREPENSIKIYAGLTKKQLLEKLEQWQDDVLNYRDSYGMPDATLQFINPHDLNGADFGVGKDNSVWPAWSACILEGDVVIPQPVKVETRFELR